MNKRLFNKGEDHQHFSLRKLTVGVASVLLGTTFMIYGGRTVQADTNATAQQPQTEVTQKDENKANSNENTVQASKDTVVANDDKVEKTNQSSTTSVTDNSKSTSVDKDVEDKTSLTANTNNVANEDVSSSKAVTDSNQNSDTATEEKFIKALGLDKLDLSDEQLKNLGLDRNTFLRNGVKYKAVASFEVFTLDGKHYTYSIKPFHTANGDLDESTGAAVREKLLNDFDAIYNAGILDATYTARLAPYLQGKTIYVNKGHELTDQDARRALPDKYANGYKNVTWDKQLQKQVNVNVAGTYTGAVDVVYKSEVGVSTEVEINVVDPKGQDTTVHINQPVPDPGTTVIPNTYPTGSTITWVTQPDTSKPGPQKVTVIITYPDGTKSNPVETTVTVIDDTIKKHQQVGTITMIRHVHFVEQGNENVDLAPATQHKL